MANWAAIAVLGVSTLASASGSVILKHAAAEAQPALAVLGATPWAGSAAGFVWLANSNDLSTLAIATAALGPIVLTAIGVAVFAEAITAQKLIALVFLIAALAVLSWPGKGG